MIKKIKKIENKLDVIEQHLRAAEKTITDVKERHSAFGKKLLEAILARPK
tara:strand:- start:3251 stop:3400 length:150 start_codon:yes stop_codon:yes gene_type:complete